MEIKTGYLRLIMGPMFSSKSTHIVNYIDNLKKENVPTLVISHSFDDRYLKNHVVTHEKIKRPCVSTTELHKIFETEDYENSEVIIIEEAQFFKELYSFVKKSVNEHNKYLIVSGLSGDIDMNPFGEINSLTSFADDIVFLKAYCFECKEPASFTTKIAGNNNTIEIGGSEIYKPVCRKHHRKFICG